MSDVIEVIRELPGLSMETLVILVALGAISLAAFTIYAVLAVVKELRK